MSVPPQAVSTAPAMTQLAQCWSFLLFMVPRSTKFVGISADFDYDNPQLLRLVCQSIVVHT